MMDSLRSEASQIAETCLSLDLCFLGDGDETFGSQMSKEKVPDLLGLAFIFVCSSSRL